ncbi:hypothetical protein [Bradyrhizobium sp.]|uniref:hypothetical protein n=1 Tax=Bradyrhizobium sp. TaxID=376 RepID=UPI0026197292|nr:hypothetical protein [Bradyrhizobium sp.]
MKGCSVYVVGDDGHFSKRFDFSCRNDAEAKSRAEQLLVDTLSSFGKRHDV